MSKSRCQWSEDGEDAFARIVVAYAESEGAELVKEYERLQADPNFKIPEGLDDKCFAAMEQALIERRKLNTD